MENETKGFNFKRIIAAAVILPLLIVYVYFLSKPFFLLLLLIVAVLAMREYYLIYEVPTNLYVPGIVIGGVLFCLFCLYPEYFLEGVFVGLFLLFTLRLIVSSPSGSMSEIGPLGIGIFYISGFLCFQWYIRNEVDGLKYIFLLYASVWIADSMAYYIGKYLGKNKLYISVSPNKTIEGAFGSLLGGAVGALTATYILDITDLSFANAVATGVLLGITTLLGDLIESMFKRDAGVKDSSNFIPGHGGILDKIDGLLVSGPVLYLVMRYF